MKADKILNMLKKYNTVSIIGMEKNVGKTTALKHILKTARGNTILGLTSIGRDGEDKDRVTGTEKPRIYVERGTLIATAKQCLFQSDITREILNATGINTPMGEVIIARALSDGYVELGGPSINAYMHNVCNELMDFGAELTIIDGALSRRSLASPAVSESTILSTGASLSRSMAKVVEKTAQTVKLLSVKVEKSKRILDICKEITETSRIGIIYKDSSYKKLLALTSLEAAKDITEELSDAAEYVVIKGIISDKLLEDIMKSSDRFKKVTFIAEDGTKLFLNNDTLNKFEKLGGRLKVMEPINVICLTANPKSPSGYEFDRERFLEKLREHIDLPIFDVVGGD